MISSCVNHSKLFVQAPNEKAVLVFAHGAGADMNHEFLINLTDLLIEHNISVLRFNFPYMDKRLSDGKKRPPDRMPVLVDCYKSILSDIESNSPLFIGGKSMGSRVAITLLAEGEDKLVNQVKGAICLGYPFHPINKPDKLRLTPLQSSSFKTLICQGERDKLGNKQEVQNYNLPDCCQVVFFDDGDHDLKPRIKSGFNHQQHLKTSVEVMSRFIDEQSKYS